MSMMTRNNTDDLNAVQNRLKNSRWLVACLCAAWCGTCTSYKNDFDGLAEQFPDKCFAWIDIEDHAELVDELDIENFPTLLIQRDDDVAFLGTMLPDVSQLKRLLASIEENTGPIKRSALNGQAPENWNLRSLILAHSV